MKGLDLEGLRAILGDKRTHLAVAIVEKVEILEDLSSCRVQIKTLPDELEMIATMTWAYCSKGGGVFAPVDVKDLVLCGFLGPDEVFILSRISSLDDKIPSELKDGTTVISSMPGKKLLLKSDTEIRYASLKDIVFAATEKLTLTGGTTATLKGTSKTIVGATGGKVSVGKGGDADLTEPIVLGTQAKAFLEKIVTHLDTLITKLTTGPVVICGAPGTPGTTFPALATDLATLKASLAADKTTYLTTAASNILSQTVFTER